MYNAQSSIEKRMSSLSITSKSESDYGVNRMIKYEPVLAYVNRSDQHRRRLSSTGEGSGDSSTTTSGGSSYGEREDASEGRAESEEYEERDVMQANNVVDGHVSDLEKQQLETFFRGLKTGIFVSGSLANLYKKTPQDTEWQLKYTGIPIVLLDEGEARSRNKRKIQLILAERGTCFMLWRDTIDNLSNYKVSGEAFHTMFCSSDHTEHIGISFDVPKASQELWKHIEALISDPENISLSGPGKKKKKKDKKLNKPAPLPPKSYISQPCCFQHVTKVARDDRSRYASLKQLIPKVTTFQKLRQPEEDF